MITDYIIISPIKGKSLCFDIFLHEGIHSIQLNWKQYEASVMNLNYNVPFENNDQTYDTNGSTQGRSNCYPSREAEFDTIFHMH
jgi:hypothetical protein